MRLTQLIAIVGFAIVSTAWASGQAKSPSASPAVVKSPAAAQQQLVSRQAEVKRLKQDVNRQESDSKRASERLQQQDQAIAELQMQLHELQARSASDSR
jgi:septal ring factor EnvC (AmiA/AmiB activator)